MSLTWDELDRLADFSAGLLTGADADLIAHLIATDPHWTTAHTTLQHTGPTIQAALHTAARHTPPAPPDLTVALDRLHDAAPRTRTRRERPSWLALLRRRQLVTGFAAVLLLVCGIGGVASLKQLLGSAARENDSAGPVSTAEAGSGTALPPIDGSQPYLFASGTDYQPETLNEMVVMVPQSFRAVTTTQLGSSPLAELTTAAGFTACAAAVRSRHPGVVRAADFARFEGAPAVILRVEVEGASVIVAVDPQCGSDGDPHELASVQIP